MSGYDVLKWQHIGERCAKVERLRAQAKEWLHAGDPETSGGMSYWMRKEAEMFAALTKYERRNSGNEAERLTDEEAALIDAVSKMNQDIYRLAGELLLKRAQDAIDDARKSAAEVGAVCDELEGKP